MKKILVLFVIIIPMFCKAQVPTFGFIAKKYTFITNNGNSTKVVTGQIVLLYNDRYCQLIMPGVNEVFSIDGYSKTINSEGLVHESFINAEDKINQRGWFDFDITRNKNGTAQILIQKPMLQSGWACFSNDAQVYSVNGKLTSGTTTKVQLPEKVMHIPSERIATSAADWRHHIGGAFCYENFDSFLQARMMIKGLEPVRSRFHAYLILEIDSSGTGKFTSIDQFNVNGSNLKEEEVIPMFSPLPKFLPALNEKGVPVSTTVSLSRMFQLQPDFNIVPTK